MIDELKKPPRLAPSDKFRILKNYMNYRRNIGESQDMISEIYTSFIDDIDEAIRDYKNIIVCSSHEYDMEVLKMNDNYQIISGGLLKTSKVDKIDSKI